MERPAFSQRAVAFLVGVPIAWGILLLFHPTGDGDDFYPVVRDHVTAWLVVHLGTMLFIPLMAVVVYLLVRGVDGRAARVTRIALAFFAVLYLAFETLVGVGLGILVDEVNELPAGETSTGAGLVEAYSDSTIIRVIEYAGSLAWYVALVAAAVALVRHAAASRWVAVLLVLSAVPISWHVPPFGQAGLALFAGAVVLVVRGRSAVRPAPLPVPRPRPA